MCRVICVDVIKWRIAVCMGKVWLQGTEFRVSGTGGEQGELVMLQVYIEL